MKPFYPDFFLKLSSLLASAEWTGWFNKTVPYQGGLFGGFFRRSVPKEIEVISESARNHGNEFLASFEEYCLEVELTTSLVTIQKLRRLLTQDDCLWRQFGDLATELQGRLVDEMHGKLFFSLTPWEAEYYTKPRKGWEEIIARFPDTVSDIEEASKCFALSRYTAVVFHSLQVVESGLIELGKFINVADPASGWTAVARELKRIMDKRYEERTDFEKRNFGFLEQVQGTVEALKNAWRNKVSHSQGKLTLLTKDFSPDIAEEILFASRAFMRRLAEGLPPSPDGSRDC